MVLCIMMLGSFSGVAAAGEGETTDCYSGGPCDANDNTISIQNLTVNTNSISGVIVTDMYNHSNNSYTYIRVYRVSDYTSSGMVVNENMVIREEETSFSYYTELDHEEYVLRTYNFTGDLTSETWFFGPETVLPNITANRDIENQYLSPGESTRVTVTINSSINQALVFTEYVPEGWTLERVSDRADAYKESNHEWLFIDVGAGETRIVTYDLIMPMEISSAFFYLNGYVSADEPAGYYVDGENQIQFNLLGYYRGLGNDPLVVETLDLNRARFDWQNEIPIFEGMQPIYTFQILQLAKEWRESGKVGSTPTPVNSSVEQVKLVVTMAPVNPIWSGGGFEKRIDIENPSNQSVIINALSISCVGNCTGLENVAPWIETNVTGSVVYHQEIPLINVVLPPGEIQHISIGWVTSEEDANSVEMVLSNLQLQIGDYEYQQLLNYPLPAIN